MRLCLRLRLHLLGIPQQALDTGGETFWLTRAQLREIERTWVFSLAWLAVIALSAFLCGFSLACWLAFG